MKTIPPPDLEPGEEAVWDALRRDSRPACPSPARLQAYTAEALPPEDHRAVLGHTSHCAACRALVAAFGDWEGAELDDVGTRRIWSDTRQKSARAGRRRAWLWTFGGVSIAAAAALALVLSSPTPPPVVPEKTTSFAPIEALPVLRMPQAAWRGPDDDTFDRDLAQALGPYKAGEFDEAIRRLKVVADRYSDAASPRLYLGVSHLLRGRPEEAVGVLEEANARAGEFWRPHVQWYLAAAYDGTRRPHEADRLRRALCASSDPRYVERACRAQ